MNLPIQLDTRAQQEPGYNLGPSFEMEYALQRWLRAKVEAGNVPPSFTSAEPLCVLTGAAIALCLLAAVATPLRAQDPLSRVGPKTQVKSVEFRFKGKHTLPEEEIRKKVALSGQGGMVGVRRVLGFLPFVPPVGSHPFDPLEMQRDVVRLRNHYSRSGFPKADIGREARYDAKSDLIRVTYVIAEGPPLLLHSVRFVGDSGTLKFPPELAPEWDQFVKARAAEHRPLRPG